jgi:uncharacterized protein YceK
MKTLTRLLLIAPLLCTCGCASLLLSHPNLGQQWNGRNERNTRVFPGVVLDGKGLYYTLSSPVSWMWRDDVPPWAVLAAPLFIVDLPFSLVADCFYLPSDLDDVRTVREAAIESEKRWKDDPVVRAYQEKQKRQKIDGDANGERWRQEHCRNERERLMVESNKASQVIGAGAPQPER